MALGRGNGNARSRGDVQNKGYEVDAKNDVIKDDDDTAMEQHEEQHHGIHPGGHSAEHRQDIVPKGQRGRSSEHRRDQEKREERLAKRLEAEREVRDERGVEAIGVNEKPADGRLKVELTEEQELALGRKSLGVKHTSGSDVANAVADRASVERASEGWVALPSVETPPELDVVAMPSVTTPNDRNVVAMESVATGGWSEPQHMDGPETETNHEYRQDNFARAAEDQDITGRLPQTTELLSNEAREAEENRDDDDTVETTADAEVVAEDARAVPVSEEAVTAQLDHENVKEDLTDEEKAAERQRERVVQATAEGTPVTPESQLRDRAQEPETR